MRTKSQSSWIHCTKGDYAKGGYKVCGDYIEFDTEQTESTKSAEKPKKTKLENAYLYKPVLSKIMTKHELCVKDNFSVPLTPNRLLSAIAKSVWSTKQTQKKQNILHKYAVIFDFVFLQFRSNSV